MSENSTIPYLLQLKEAVNAIHLSETEVNTIEIPREVSIVEPACITLIPSYEVGIEQICVQPTTQVFQKNPDNIMEIETQNIEQVTNSDINFIYEVVYPEQLNLKPIYNLKRGRPKKKKVVEVVPAEPPKTLKAAPRTRSGRLVKFPKYIEKDFKKVEIEDALENEEPEVKTSEFTSFAVDDTHSKKTNDTHLEFHQRRRKISAQYRCPKCHKAYLGKFKMAQHLKKYPDHGPLPHDELNFDVWNYLVDITQKCPPTQRGMKFCEELTNLLHNVLLLTSALFKKAELNKNHVDVDKVLGNAIGLPPGPYKFNDNELYKDVTVLKLITNSDFFKPVSRDVDVDESEKSGKTEKSDHKSSKSEANCKEKSKSDLSGYFTQQEDKKPTASANVVNGVRESSSPDFDKGGTLDRSSDHTDLLSENALLHMPNLRGSVDELIMSGTNLLDNSTSSDEVMNVDQFVNERFKKITEPEVELGGGGLNLDLPGLDLFQFHGS